MTITKRELVTCIILTIVTCGIYGIYWMVKLNDETNVLVGNQNGTSGITVVLLTIVTCGIYGYFWYFKMGEKVDFLKARRGLAASNSGIIYLLLGIFGLGIVNYCLIQDEINNNLIPPAPQFPPQV